MRGTVKMAKYKAAYQPTIKINKRKRESKLYHLLQIQNKIKIMPIVTWFYRNLTIKTVIHQFKDLIKG